ncbi:MAG: PAS domain S-box protein [Bacteroidota bacterium]|nr:PAS domain S-box protein [Bacteroidota bacterium]
MNKSAWLITLIYFTLSFLWITLSDKILLSFGYDPVILSKIQTYKGWIFVLLSTVLIYILTSKSIKKFIDIDQRKTRHIKYLKQLKEKEKQLSILIGNLKGIVYRCQNDTNWTMSYLSNGIEEITGYKPEELINNKKIAYAHLIVPADRQKVQNKIQQALEINKQFRITYRIKTKKNATKWVWEQGVGNYNENGELRWIEGYITDITEQKLTEIALQKSEQKYKNLVENSLVGIYTSNINGELIYANKAFCNILGYTNSDEININDLYPAKEQREKLINTIKQNKRISNYEILLLTKLGEAKNITINASLNGDEISGMIIDITHLKEYEKQLLVAKEEAEKASKIKDVFIGNISHEIRTPLNAINGFTNILKSKFEKHIDDRSNEFFQIIFNASSRLERTVDMMLDYAKLNADDMEIKPLKVDFIQIIENILEEHQVEIKKKNLEIIIEQNTENTQLIIDQYAVENAFSNIIQNAIKYTVPRMDLLK